MNLNQHRFYREEHSDATGSEVFSTIPQFCFGMFISCEYLFT